MEVTTEELTAEQVRAIRASLGLTQDEFAAALGVSQQTVSRWETIGLGVGVSRAYVRRENAAKVTLMLSLKRE